MADRSSQLIVSALSQALSHAETLPLHSSRSRAGLFPTSTAGKAAALRCQQEGWLAPDADGCLITEKGIRHLLARVSPRQVLEDLVRVLESRQDEVTQLVATAHRMQASLEGLRVNAERVLAHIDGPANIEEMADRLPGELNTLRRQFQTRSPELDADADPEPLDLPELIAETLANRVGPTATDCPLPALFRLLVAVVPDLTIGGFHDALRELYAHGRISLLGWTAPMYELPEPPFALLVGHEVAYYASLRPAN